MSDQREFKIKVTVDSAQAVQASQQQATALKQVADAAKTSGEKSAEVAVEATKQTKGWGKAQDELKAAVKGLSLEVPILGRAWAFISNPITASMTGIVLGLSKISEKLRATESDFGKGTWGIDKANAAAEAWKAYGVAMSGVRADAEGLAASLKDINQQMTLISKLAKQQEIDLKSNPLFAKGQAEMEANAMAQKAAETRAIAADLEKRAADADPKTSAERDANTQAMLDADAAQAAAEIKRVDAELKRIHEATRPAVDAKDRIGQIPGRLGLAWDYSAFEKPDDIRRALESERAGYQSTVDRAKTGVGRTETRSAARTASEQMRKQAAELSAEADKMDQQAKEKRFSGQLNYYTEAMAQGVQPMVTPAAGTNPGGFGVTPEVKAYYDKANADLMAMGKIWAEVVATLRAQAERQAAQTKNSF